jgi:hypothetical protein
MKPLLVAIASALSCVGSAQAQEVADLNGTSQKCEDVKYAAPWADSLGYTCADYAKEQLCTADGNPSAAFIELYGEDWSLADFAFVNSAADVCVDKQRFTPITIG